MTYHDDIITITLCRGELAASLGEMGYMVKSWPKFTAALERELISESVARGDGHTGISAVGDLLLDRILCRYDYKGNGIGEKPDSGKNECWPEGQKWFDGEEGE